MASKTKARDLKQKLEIARLALQVSSFVDLFDLLFPEDSISAEERETLRESFYKWARGPTSTSNTRLFQRLAHCLDIAEPNPIKLMQIAAHEFLALLPERYRQRVANTSNDSWANDSGSRVRWRLPHSEREHYSRIALNSILEAIGDEIGNNPDLPEFPPFNRRFPATNTKLLSIDGRQIYVKDESELPTGTHKARWAWEMIVQYKDFIQDALLGDGHLPRYSMISSGSAAIALQYFLLVFGLPGLHVLMDSGRAQPDIVRRLNLLGARVYTANLEETVFTADDVLSITENEHGIDVTTRDITIPDRKNFYDWLTYEVLNLRPKHIFVPVGTGDLFTNMIFMITRHHEKRNWDARLDAQTVAGINVYGATTSNPHSAMNMLYAPFRPGLNEFESELERLKRTGGIGEDSGIYELEDEWATSALNHIARGALDRESRTIYSGMRSDMSGIAGLGLFLQRAGHVPTHERVVVVNTGCVDL